MQAVGGGRGPRMAPVRRALALLAPIAVIVGCGSDDAETPAACLTPASAYLEALEEAPGEVRLEGTTAISDCIVPSQEGGELSQVGSATVDAATRLNAEAARDSGGEATVQLGYLVGAVQEGAAETGGIHADLVRRLDTAARATEGDEPFSARFERAFGEGYAAAQEGG
jgi:hypothetical protein